MTEINKKNGFVIKNLMLDNKFILAPMAGFTDLPFRLLCKEQGCALSFTEMVSAKGLYYLDKKTKQLMITDKKEKPIGIQIFGSDPYIMSEVVKKHINNEEFDIIDINSGCPTPKIVKNGDGSALMKSPQLIGEIIYSITRVTELPVTIKIRSGWDSNNINAVEVAKIAQEAGASAITVHGRTREQLYQGNANWDVIRDVKNSVTIPVIGNGDVNNYKDAENLYKHTKCDGIMIGRASMGNPWIFNNLIKYFENGCNNTIVEDNVKIYTALKHMKMMLDIKPERIVVAEMRKHISSYTKNLKGSAQLRKEINNTRSTEDIYNLLTKFAKET